MFSYEICRSVTSPIHANTATSPVMATNSDLPIAVEPVEAQNIIDLPIAVEPVEAQNNIELPIGVEPIEAQNIELPIGVEPIEAQNIIEQPIIEIHEAENENQIWFINYGKECQGLIIADREIESHYYDIHTALLNTFLNSSYAILILEGL